LSILRDSPAEKRVRAMQTQGKQALTRKVGLLGGSSDRLARKGLSEPSLTRRSSTTGNLDPLFLFACHVKWSRQRNLRAYEALVAGLDDSDRGIRAIAEMMLHRGSPRPPREGRGAYTE
jgi:hypothetical protein